jgi:4a-hydroxytetrahydrobiopterin dehydratase
MALALSMAQVTEKLQSLPGWALTNGEITKTFIFKDFAAAMLFVGSVAYQAEALAHHPDITIKWNKVTLALVTHDAGGITDKDFDAALAFNALPALG